MQNKINHIILFDGVCNLCNASVQFIIKHDNKQYFNFASLQSEFGKALLIKNQIDANKTDSIVYINNEKVYVKSSAALHVSKYLGSAWPLLFIFIIVPKFLRDWLYDIIAKNRYKWFGKKDSCMIPNPELKSRFLG